MARKVWIIAKKEQVEQADIDNAILNGCPEIANGIPPVLRGIISPDQLPYAYEEPEAPPTPEPRNLEAEVDTLKAELDIAKMQAATLEFDATSKGIEIDAIKAKIVDYDELKAKIEKVEKAAGFRR